MKQEHISSDVSPSGDIAWEELRLRVRQLQQALEKQLAELNPLTENIKYLLLEGDRKYFNEVSTTCNPGEWDYATESNAINKHQDKDAVEACLMNAFEAKRKAENLLLQGEAELNRMETLCHTPLQRAQKGRFRDIFTVLCKDLRLLNLNLEAYLDRSRLQLHSFDRQGSNSLRNADGIPSEIHSALRERVALDASITIVEELVSQGKSTSQKLRGQRSRIGMVSSKMRSMIADSLPAVSNIISRISRVRMKHQACLALVVFLCILLAFWRLHILHGMYS